MSVTVEQVVLTGMSTGSAVTLQDVFWCVVVLLIVTFVFVKLGAWRDGHRHRQVRHA